MDKGYEKEGFDKIGIKTSVAKRFRSFSNKISKSQSMTLLLMIDFFETNKISPDEKMGPAMQTLEERISMLFKKRINGMIAIMKDIEKTQTKPTVGMLQSLFEEVSSTKNSLILEKKVYDEQRKVRFEEKKNFKKQL